MKNKILSALLGALAVGCPASYLIGVYSTQVKQLDWMTVSRVCTVNSRQLEAHVKRLMTREETRLVRVGK